MSQTPTILGTPGPSALPESPSTKNADPITDDDIVSLIGPPAPPEPPPADAPLPAEPIPYRRGCSSTFLVDRSVALIDIFFLIASVTCVGVGFFMIADSFYGTLRAQEPWGLLGGLLIATLGPLTLRVLCNALLMICRIYQCLVEIEDALEDKRGS